MHLAKHACLFDVLFATLRRQIFPAIDVGPGALRSSTYQRVLSDIKVALVPEAAVFLLSSPSHPDAVPHTAAPQPGASAREDDGSPQDAPPSTSEEGSEGPWQRSAFDHVDCMAVRRMCEVPGEHAQHGGAALITITREGGLRELLGAWCNVPNVPVNQHCLFLHAQECMRHQPTRSISSDGPGCIFCTCWRGCSGMSCTYGAPACMWSTWHLHGSKLCCSRCVDSSPTKVPHAYPGQRQVNTYNFVVLELVNCLLAQSVVPHPPIDPASLQHALLQGTMSAVSMLGWWARVWGAQVNGACITTGELGWKLLTGARQARVCAMCSTLLHALYETHCCMPLQHHCLLHVPMSVMRAGFHTAATASHGVGPVHRPAAWVCSRV